MGGMLDADEWEEFTVDVDDEQPTDQPQSADAAGEPDTDYESYELASSDLDFEDEVLESEPQPQSEAPDAQASSPEQHTSARGGREFAYGPESLGDSQPHANQESEYRQVKRPSRRRGRNTALSAVVVVGVLALAAVFQTLGGSTGDAPQTATTAAVHSHKQARRLRETNDLRRAALVREKAAARSAARARRLARRRAAAFASRRDAKRAESQPAQPDPVTAPEYVPSAPEPVDAPPPAASGGSGSSDVPSSGWGWK